MKLLLIRTERPSDPRRRLARGRVLLFSPIQTAATLVSSLAVIRDAIKRTDKIVRHEQ